MLGRRAPFGVYEGAFADRNPVACLCPSTVVGSQDIAVGRFGWADPATDEVSNAKIVGALYGIVMPRPGTWELTYMQRSPGSPPVRMLRAGKPVIVWVSGDFYLRFPLGALIGATVYTDPATGIAYGTNLGGYIATKWSVTTNVAPGGLGIVSPYTKLS